MADYTVLVIIASAILLLAQYYAMKYLPRFTIHIFAICCIILSGLGIYLSTTDNNKNIFEVLLLLAGVGFIVMFVWELWSMSRQYVKIATDYRR